jgi:RNA polymerase sigma-32 factor
VRAKVSTTMESLSDRERYLVENRLMATEPETLQEIGDRFFISRERTRQLEAKVKVKIRKVFLSGAAASPAGLP